MAGIVGVFAAIGEHLPILKEEKFSEPQPEGTVSRLHYRTTATLILGFCLLVTSTEWVSGTDSIINCLHTGPVPQNVINHYCYIMGTFSVPRHYVDHESEIGSIVAQTGVGPYVPNKDYVEIKAYYQWVPFVLFLQGAMFYIPHLIYKYAEGGKIKLIIAGLHQWVLDKADRAGRQEELAKYMVGTRGSHTWWCVNTFIAHLVYLANVIGQIVFTDCFLGWEFYTYGVNAASFLESSPEGRIDPMSRVFPRMTKCTFQKYGPSGSIQTHDAQCVLPINIINEKIYVFLWFWFGILSALTLLDMLFDAFVVFSPRARKIILKRKLALSPMKDQLEVDTDLIYRCFDYGDWKVLYNLLRNMDALVFNEFCAQLTSQLQKALDLETKGDLMSLRALLDNDSNRNPNKADNFLLEAEDIPLKKKTTDI